VEGEFYSAFTGTVVISLAFGVGLGNMVREISYEGAPISYLRFIASGLVATAVMNHGFFETTYSSFCADVFSKDV